MGFCGDGFTSGSRQVSKKGPISEILHEAPLWEMVQDMLYGRWCKIWKMYIPDSSRAGLNLFLVSEYPWLHIWVPLEYPPQPRVIEWL